MVPALLLLCVALWLILRGGLYGLSLHFVLVFFSPFSIVSTLLGEEKAGLCAFCVFVCFGHVGLRLSFSFGWFGEAKVSFI